jgi:hypothetical protein
MYQVDTLYLFLADLDPYRRLLINILLAQHRLVAPTRKVPLHHLTVFIFASSIRAETKSTESNLFQADGLSSSPKLPRSSSSLTPFTASCLLS